LKPILNSQTIVPSAIPKSSVRSRLQANRRRF
jgi:hypothetical protein